jgi:hypothetical protein
LLDLTSYYSRIEALLQKTPDRAKITVASRISRNAMSDK